MALFSLMTLECRVRVRGLHTPTGLTVSLSTVLNSGTVVTLPQTLYQVAAQVHHPLSVFKIFEIFEIFDFLKFLNF